MPDADSAAVRHSADTPTARLARARAQAALHGYTVIATNTRIVVERWGLMREFDELDDLECWLAFVLGGRR